MSTRISPISEQLIRHHILELLTTVMLQIGRRLTDELRVIRQIIIGQIITVLERLVRFRQIHS